MANASMTIHFGSDNSMMTVDIVSYSVGPPAGPSTAEQAEPALARQPAPPPVEPSPHLPEPGALTVTTAVSQSDASLFALLSGGTAIASITVTDGTAQDVFSKVIFVSLTESSGEVPTAAITFDYESVS
jgi:hypothetical protein